MTSPLTVRIAINTSSAFGRSLLDGIARYTRTRGPWTLLLEPIGFGMNRYSPAQLRVDGTIARIVDQAVADSVLPTPAPLINVSDAVPGLGVPQLVPDHEGIGRLAEDHLLACGFWRFGFCGFAGQSYSESRQRGFVGRLAEKGRDCAVYANRVAPEGGDSLQDELADLASWLRGFGEPAGVFACNDWRGQHVLLAALTARIAVPEKLGVLGVDNDSAVCDLCPVPLSSIDPGAEHIGYCAAEALDAWMRGGERPELRTVSDGFSLFRRRSTDVLAVADPIIHRALSLMRGRECMPRSIEELLRQLPISRRPFETRFRKSVGLTPHEALTRFRVDHAADLLRNTDLPVQRIAERCGFVFGHHFAAAFRRHSNNMTPSAYRKRWQDRE